MSNLLYATSINITSIHPCTFIVLSFQLQAEPVTVATSKSVNCGVPTTGAEFGSDGTVLVQLLARRVCSEPAEVPTRCPTS